MASALKRSIAFLLVLVLVIGMIPTVFAAEVEPTDSTTPDTHATDPPEETTSENTLPVSQTEPETISLPEDEMDFLALDNGIAAFAEAEITGAPNAFANLTLPNGGIGYRWEFKKGINVRLDYGLSKNGGGFIFSLNEAF